MVDDESRFPDPDLCFDSERRRADAKADIGMYNPFAYSRSEFSSRTE